MCLAVLRLLFWSSTWLTWLKCRKRSFLRIRKSFHLWANTWNLITVSICRVLVPDPMSNRRKLCGTSPKEHTLLNQTHICFQKSVVTGCQIHSCGLWPFDRGLTSFALRSHTVDLGLPAFVLNNRSTFDLGHLDLGNLKMFQILGRNPISFQPH